MPDTTLLEPRYNCPVCQGLPMQKLKITRRDKGVFLTLDCCQRCGGVWFDKDEVQLSQQITSPNIRQRITQKPKTRLSHCHSCNALIDRNLDQCTDCGWHNRIACPVCQKTLQRKQHQQLTLDICHSCKGIWFDQADLLALWSTPLNRLSNSSDQKVTSTITLQKSRDHSDDGVVQAVGDALLEGGLNSMVHGADMIIEPGLQAIGKTVSSATQGSVQVLTSTPEVAGGVVESLAEITSSVVEAVVESEIVTIIFEVTGEVAGGMVEGLSEVIAGLF